MFVFPAAAAGAKLVAAGLGFGTAIGFRRLCRIVRIEDGARPGFGFGAIVHFCATSTG